MDRTGFVPYNKRASEVQTKRGEDERGDASRFFSTIIRNLVLKVPSFGRLVAEVIASYPIVHDKAVGEHFEIFIYKPL